MASILLLDDEESLCRSLGRVLRSSGHEVATADGIRGIDLLKARHFDLIITDLRMPAVDGFEVIAFARQHAPNTPVIAISGSAEIPDAVRAMHAGARDFLIKPFDARALDEAVAAVLQSTVATPNVDVWRERYAPRLLGKDPAILGVLELLAAVSDTNCAVLITGETGTGKETAARALHAGSGRSNGPFATVNCTAIAGEDVETELFGRVGEARVGAKGPQSGIFIHANRGTVFLDEIAELRPRVQVKLLTLLADGDVVPVGSEKPIAVDVRVIAATSRDLEAEVTAARFRADLYWRLNLISVDIPSLRNRTGDIEELSRFFLERANARYRRAVTGFDAETSARMKAYEWPGNVRELENVVERMVLLCRTGALMANALPWVAKSQGEALMSRDENTEDRLSSEQIRTLVRIENERAPASARSKRRRVTQYHGIFLSHNHGDKPFVELLRKKLMRRGVRRVWVDEAELMVGDSLIGKIEAAIDQTRYFGVVLSPRSVTSPWVTRELQQAMNREFQNGAVIVLPILLEKCTLPGFLLDKVYADFTGDSYDDAVEMLLRRLKA